MAGELTSLSLAMGRGVVSVGAIVKLVDPRIGLIGPSTTEQNNYGANDTSVRSGNAASGPFTWAMMEHRRGQHYLTGQTASPYFIGDNRGDGGAVFADYPTQISGLSARLAVPATNRVVIYEPGRNDLQNGMSVADYKTNVLRDIADLRARGYAYIFICKPWKKPTAYGGVWASGGAARLACDQINLWMDTLVDTDVKLVDFPSVVTDPTSPDGNPYQNVTRTIDYTHITNYGGRLLGKAVNAALAPYIEEKPYPALPAENIVPAFSSASGTGTISGTGASGTVVDGWAATGSVGTLVASVEAVAGWSAPAQVFRATETNTLTANGANIVMTRTINVPASKKTGLRMKVKIPATVVPYMLFFTLGTSSGQGISPNQRSGLIAGIANITAQTAIGGAGANFASAVKFDGSEDLDLWLETSSNILTGGATTPVQVSLTITLGAAPQASDQFVVSIGEIQTFNWPI